MNTIEADVAIARAARKYVEALRTWLTFKNAVGGSGSGWEKERALSELEMAVDVAAALTARRSA